MLETPRTKLHDWVFSLFVRAFLFVLSHFLYLCQSWTKPTRMSFKLIIPRLNVIDVPSKFHVAKSGVARLICVPLILLRPSPSSSSWNELKLEEKPMNPSENRENPARDTRQDDVLSR